MAVAMAVAMVARDLRVAVAIATRVLDLFRGDCGYDDVIVAVLAF